MHEYLADPGVDPRTPLSRARLLAIDMETSGLDPRVDRMLSVGFVPVDGHDIMLGGAGSLVLRPEAGVPDGESVVGQSAVIHGLTDDDVTSGIGVREALEEIFAALRGRVLLAHHARLEIGFLRHLVHETHGVRPALPAVDTLAIQSRIVADGFDEEPVGDELRLWEARRRFGLPETHAHEALGDALACAELYLAQTRELSSLKPLKLGALLTTGRGR